MESASESGLTPPSEFRDLFLAARTGSRDALGRLLERWRAYLLHIANQELDSDLRGKVGGSDLVQQSYLDAHQGFGQFNGSQEEELRAWLVGILRHNLQDVRRRFQQTGKRSVQKEAEGALAEALDHSDPQASPAEAALLQERLRQLRDCLDKLGPAQKELIRLRQQEGLSFVDIGQRLNLTEDAARKQWSRAIEELRQLMRGYDGNSSS